MNVPRSPAQRSFLRFVLSAVSSAALDIGLFACLVNLAGVGVFAATGIARVTSGVYNFTLNRR